MFASEAVSIPMRKTGLTVCAATIFTLFGGSPPAIADCAPPGGPVVTCSGTTNGFGDGTQNNLTINILTGAVVTANPAINVGSVNTINNAGSVLAPDFGIGISLVDGNVINNSGTIRAGGDGDSIRGVGVLNNTLNNTGLIDGRVTFVGAGNAINNSGLLSILDPNASTGLAHNTNTFTQTAAGTLAVQVDNTSGVVGSVIVGGAATVAGTLRVIVRPGLYDNTTAYTGIVTAVGPLIGTFDTVVSSSPFFTPTIATIGNNIDLTLTRIPFGSVAGSTGNQQAIGNALEPGYSTTLTGSAATFYSNLLAATSLSALDQLSGEGTSAVQSAAFTAGGGFTSALSNQSGVWLSGRTADPSAMTPGASTYAQEDEKRPPSAFDALKPRPASRSRAWVAGFAGRQSLDGEAAAGSAGTRANSAGGAFGVDRQVSGDLLVGFGVGGSTSNFSVSDRGTSGDLLGGHLGVYATKTFGPLYLSAALAYAHFDNKTSRTIAGVGATETATGRFGSDQLSGRVELGYRAIYGRYDITPFAAFEFSELWQRAYSETSLTAGGGLGILGLSFGARAISSAPLTLGTQIDARILAADGLIWMPFIRVAWLHEFFPERRVDAAFITIPGAAFSVQGPRASADAFKFGAGAAVLVDPKTYLFARFEGEFSGRASSQGGTAGLKMTW